MAEEKNKKREGEEEYIPTASFAGSEDGPGGKIGPYKLLSILGEGGFGIVYLAEQQKPVKRRVALKVIKPGMDSKQVIARFEAEEQALALLDHPNVAQVHEAGMTKASRPYFAMEYVKGVPITEHCDRKKLSIEERLELFLQVCEGLQHAHQKGIIHRDIKPSNILVDIEGEKAVPKIIDFGVAKAITQPLTERTLYTEQGQLIGTPEYMSPEQAEMIAQDIDTRSDIYSLGVMLYELLTGALPFDRKSLEWAGFAEIQRIIREEEPPRPSTKLTSLGEEAEKVAKSRRTDVATLAKRLHKELEWIPLKAMCKERTHRYRSTSELADDIQNYLNGAPLTAGPESAVYRFRKFVRRRRAWVAGIAAVLVVLAGGIVVSTMFAIGQVRARAEAVRAEHLAEQHRAEAEAARDEAQTVADFLKNDVLASVEPAKAKGPEVTVRYILDAASEDIEDKFKGKPLVEASIRETLGNTYFSLGKYKAAEPHLERALEIRREQLGEEHQDTLRSMNALGWIYLRQSRHDEAEPLFANTLELGRRVLGEEYPDTLAYMGDLAALYREQGKYDKAEPLYEKTLELSRRVLGEEHPDVLDSMNNLAKLYWQQGRWDEAEPLYVKALEGQRRVLGEEHPDTLTSIYYLASLYWEKSRLDEAEPLLVKALETRRRVLGEEHPDTLESMFGLAWVYFNQGRPDEAESLYVKVVEGQSRVLGEDHPDTLRSMGALGELYRAEDRYEEAEPLQVNMMDGMRRMLGEEHLHTLESMDDLGELYFVQGRYDEAESLYIKALEVSRRVLGEEHPETLYIMNGLGNVYLAQDRFDKAEPLYVRALELRQRVLGEEHPFTIATIDNLARAYLSEGRYDEAKLLFNKVLKLRRRVFGEDHPETMDFMDNIARVYEEQHRYEEAELLFVKLLEARRRVLGEEHADTATAMWELAWVYRYQGRDDEAERLFVNVLEVRRRVLGEGHPATLETMNNLADLYREQGRYEEVEQLYEEVEHIYVEMLEIRRRAVDEEEPSTLNNLAWFQATCPVAKVRDGAKAVEYAIKACELTSWKNSSYVDTLAATYAEAGDFENGVKWQKKAIDLLPEEEEEMRADYEERLELYESGKPYRESP